MRTVELTEMKLFKSNLAATS